MRMLRPLRAIVAPGNRDRLRWAVRVRWLVIVGFFVLALVAMQAGLLVAFWPCALAAGLAALLNGLNHWCVAHWRSVALVTVLAIPGDVLLITYVVINTGGAQSPFVMMYVVQVVATAMLVDFVVAVVSALATVVCFGGALLLHGVGAIAVPGLIASSGDGSTSYRIIWALFLLYGLGLMAYLGGYVSERLRRSEEDLAQTNADLRQTIVSLERAHADLQDAYDRLKATEGQLVQSEKMRALGQFVAGIAHELNNPIAFILANIAYVQRYLDSIEQMLTAYRHADLAEPIRSELVTQRRLLRIDQLVDELPSVIQDCDEGVRRAVEIVTALRTFSRGEQHGTWGHADIHDGLDRTLALLRHRLRDSVIVERVYGALPPVECLSGQLDQVFLNLLSNAVDAVGGRGRIVIETTVEDEAPSTGGQGLHVVVKIRDDGVGIPDDVKARVFDPFFTTKAEG